MCNDYRLHVGAGTIADDFSNIKIKIRFPEGTPNIEPRDDIKITDTAPIVRTVDGDREAGVVYAAPTHPWHLLHGGTRSPSGTGPERGQLAGNAQTKSKELR